MITSDYGLEMKFFRLGEDVAITEGCRIEGYASFFGITDQGGDVDVSGTGFIVLDTSQKQSPALAKVRLSGAVTAAAWLLDREPLRVFAKARLPVMLRYVPGCIAAGLTSY